MGLLALHPRGLHGYCQNCWRLVGDVAGGEGRDGGGGAGGGGAVGGGGGGGGGATICYSA